MTRRPPLLLLILTLLAPAFALLNAVAAPDARACGGGIVGEYVDGFLLCTHGSDNPPPGVDTTKLPSTKALLQARFGVDTTAEVLEVAADDGGTFEVAGDGTVACIGDGTTGARVQLIYAHASDVSGRFSSVLPLLRQYASDVDDVINVSAGLLGEGRRVRYVTNNDCAAEVLNITLSKTGDDSFSNTVSEIRNKGLTSKDRKYLIFVDAAVGICGLGEVYWDDRPDELNPNNSGRPQYSRVDTSCWQHVAAHELLHTMGAVQLSAPNTTGAGHCTDEDDVMCYDDSATGGTTQVCDRAGQVDCNSNDYFHPTPKTGSYLDTKWNVARSRYLESTKAPLLPSLTTVTVPSTGYAGAPWAVRADPATVNASVVWSSTRSDCWFKDPLAASTSWTCPATAQGTAQITVNVTENGITTPYTTAVSLVVPNTKQTSSVSFTRSAGKITAGQGLRLTSRVVAMATGAPVPGLPVTFQVRPKGSKTWSTVGTDGTNRNGVAYLKVAPTRNVSYRTRTADNHTWATTYSGTGDVKVATKLTTKVNGSTVANYSTTGVDKGTATRLTGRVSPDKAGKLIRLRRYSNGRWRTIRERYLSDTSTYSFRYTPRTAGKHRLRVVKPGDTRNTSSRRTIILQAG